MRLFLLHGESYEGVDSRIKKLSDACIFHQLNFNIIDSLKTNHCELPSLNVGDILYNLSDGSYELESLLINEHVTTIYINNPIINNFRSTSDWTIIHKKHSIKQPKTIFHVTDNRELLKQYANYLEGFPLILKVNETSRGIGTILIENYQSLFSTVDFLISIKKDFILRQFISSKAVSRLVVLGNKVISSWESPFLENDFRNSVNDKFHIGGQRQYIPRKYSSEIENIAIRATTILNLELGGVDIIFDNNNTPYLLEVNCPIGLNHDFENSNYLAKNIINWLKLKASKKIFS